MNRWIFPELRAPRVGRWDIPGISLNFQNVSIYVYSVYLTCIIHNRIYIYTYSIKSNQIQ